MQEKGDRMGMYVASIMRGPHTGMSGTGTVRTIAQLENYAPDTTKVIFKHSLYSRTGMLVWEEILQRGHIEIPIYPMAENLWAKWDGSKVEKFGSAEELRTRIDVLVQQGNQVFSFNPSTNVQSFYQPKNVSEFPDYPY